MLEKLRDNPRAVVAALIAAGFLVVAISAGNGTETPDTDQTESPVPEVVVESGGEASTEADLSDQASEEGSEDVVSTEPVAGPVEVSSVEGSLKATVRSGDNQTVIVRQMVTDYANANEQTLSAEQKLFIETNAVNTLPRNDFVDAGQEITVEESVVADLVQKSTELDAAAIARWSAYL